MKHDLCLLVIVMLTNVLEHDSNNSTDGINTEILFIPTIFTLTFAAMVGFQELTGVAAGSILFQDVLQLCFSPKGSKS